MNKNLFSPKPNLCHCETLLMKWGVMNAQHMVEHFGDAVKNAWKAHASAGYEGEHLAKLREFMMSEKPFRENTKNPLLSGPLPLRQPSMQAAIDRLQKISIIFEAFEENPEMTTQNPIFGEWIYRECSTAAQTRHASSASSGRSIIFRIKSLATKGKNIVFDGPPFSSLNCSI
jgi:hypothetical protein